MPWGEPSVNHVLLRMHVKADYNLDNRCLGLGSIFRHGYLNNNILILNFFRFRECF